MRENLAAELADSVRRMVADGSLAPGARIDESLVAEELGVSRTPVREALYRLTPRGFVESRPRRGFYVGRLDESSARQLYQMRAVLDPAALRMSGIPEPRSLDRLSELNDEIGRAEDVEERIDLDDAWHLELLSGCPNEILLDLVREFMQRTRPLERAYMRTHGSGETMVTQHTRIENRLRRGDLDGAVATLRDNMESGMGPMLRWLADDRPELHRLGRR